MIHRAEHDNEFTRVKNSLINDERLSFEARGFMVFILSLPDNWNFSVRGLIKQTGLNMSVVERLMSELKKCGYAESKKARDSRGRITAHSWDFYELPQDHISKSPYMENTIYGKDHISQSPNMDSTIYGETADIQTTNNNKLINKTNDSLEQTNRTESKKFTPPTVEEVKSYCQERGNSVDPEAFCDFYTSKGWKVGKNPMKDWKAAVRTWEKRDRRPKPIKTSGNEFTELLGEEGFTI